MSAGAMPRVSRACSAMGLVTALVSGCQGAGKGQAAALDDALDRYRRAVGPERASASRALAEVPCTGSDVCAAKETCLAAVDSTTRAFALKDEVALAVGDLQAKRMAPDAAAAQALPGKLDEATLLLGQGRGKMADCEKMLVDLRLHYGH